MTPIEKDKLEILCKKWNLSELKISKGIYMADDNSGITANLRGDMPLVGVTIAGTFQTEGHGILKVADIQTEMNQIMKSKEYTLRYPPGDKIEPPVDKEKLKEIFQKAQSSSIAQEGVAKPPVTQSAKSKLGAGDTHISKTTAICKDCGTSFETTLDNAQQLMAQFSELYCPKCRGKHETKTSEAIKSAEIKGNVPATPKPEAKPAVIRTCKSCGLELSGARALECFQKDKAFICEECEEKQNGGTKMETEIVDQNQNLPATKKKQELVIGKCEAVAAQYGILSEMANLFFMTMDGSLYIKNPGLLYLASKKGYSRIEVTTTYDEKAQEWSAECKIYPKLTKDILEGISHLDKDIQKIAFDFATQPTNGTGRASKLSVRMSTMHAFLKEMAQTRAQNRAPRAFTGYGGTSDEELPEAQLERD